LSFDEVLLDDAAEVERLRELADDDTFRVFCLSERWLLTRDDAAFELWPRAGVLDTFRDDADEARVVAVVLRVAPLLLFARGAAVALRVCCVVARLRVLFAFRLLLVAGVAVRVLPALTARPFALLLLVRLVARVPAVARAAFPRLFSAARTALELSVLRDAPLVVVAREFSLERLVATPRSRLSAVREATARTFDASVTLAGRAVLRVLGFTSGR